MIAVDDGIINGNLDAADFFFIIAIILSILASGVYASAKATIIRWGPVLLSLSITAVAVAFLIL